MQAFLEFVVKGLVDHPEAVSIVPVKKEDLTVYELRVDPRDVARIIGRQGTTINAIRSLMVVGSAKKGVRCVVEILEDRPPGEDALAERSSQ